MGSHHLTGRLRGPRNESYKPASSLATGIAGSRLSARRHQKALGIDVPAALLVRADEIIE
jgi:hypothetical protein